MTTKTIRTRRAPTVLLHCPSCRAASRQARCLTVGEAAQVMSVSPRHARRLAAAGAVIAHQQGHDWLIDAAAAAEYRGRRAEAWQQEQRAA